MRLAAGALALAAGIGVAPAAVAIPATGQGRLVFVSVDGAGRGTALVSAAPDGTGRRVLVRGFPWMPALSPDGSRIAFSAASSADFLTAYLHSGIEVVEDGRTHRLTQNHVGDWAPRWSPDARSIAFDRRNSFGSVQVVIVPAAGGAARVVADGAGAAWSPDGARLAFAAVPGGESAAEVFVAGVDGSGLRRVTTGADGRSVSGPSFSPDGARIAFFRGGELDVMRLDGSDLRALGAGVSNAAPAWSPDGKRVATGCGRGDLCIFPAAGGAPARVAGRDSFAGVAWSPDGTRLVFSSGNTVYVVGADGRGRRAIGRGRSPDWR